MSRTTFNSLDHADKSICRQLGGRVAVYYDNYINLDSQGHSTRQNNNRGALNVWTCS